MKAVSRQRKLISEQIMTTGLAQQLIKLCYAIAGVIAVVGTLNVYIEMNMEDGHAKRNAAITVGICALLFVVAYVIGEIWL